MQLKDLKCQLAVQKEETANAVELEKATQAATIQRLRKESALATECLLQANEQAVADATEFKRVVADLRTKCDVYAEDIAAFTKASDKYCDEIVELRKQCRAVREECNVLRAETVARDTADAAAAATDVAAVCEPSPKRVADTEIATQTNPLMLERGRMSELSVWVMECDRLGRVVHTLVEQVHALQRQTHALEANAAMLTGVHEPMLCHGFLRQLLGETTDIRRVDTIARILRMLPGGPSGPSAL